MNSRFVHQHVILNVQLSGKESKGRPGSIRIYPINSGSEEVIPAPLVQKHFKADRCQFRWSPNGRNLLAFNIHGS